jgi:mannose-6-phosphate isomerase-like protein (cupin superfamily)
VGITVLIVDAPPGGGPALHKHPYEEILIVQEGQGTFVVGDEELVVSAGEVAIVPPDTPHSFVNTGDGPLRQIDIHVSPSFSTEWLSR